MRKMRCMCTNAMYHLDLCAMYQCTCVSNVLTTMEYIDEEHVCICKLHVVSNMSMNSSQYSNLRMKW